MRERWLRHLDFPLIKNHQAICDISRCYIGANKVKDFYMKARMKLPAVAELRRSG